MKKKSGTESGIRRREFLGVTLSAPVIILGAGCNATTDGLSLEHSGFVGASKTVAGATPREGASWYEAAALGDGIQY